MIIAITIRDNDFGDLIESYLKKFRKNLTLELSSVCDADVTRENKDAFVEFFETYDKINYLLNPNNEIKYTEEQLNFLTNRIKLSFEYYKKEYLTYRDGNIDDLEYVMNNLKITFPKHLIDKWENGEMFYYLLHSGIVVNQ